jgi:hypothetical protein
VPAPVAEPTGRRLLDVVHEVVAAGGLVDGGALLLPAGRACRECGGDGGGGFTHGGLLLVGGVRVDPGPRAGLRPRPGAGEVVAVVRPVLDPAHTVGVDAQPGARAGPFPGEGVLVVLLEAGAAEVLLVVVVRGQVAAVAAPNHVAVRRHGRASSRAK